MFAGSEDKKCPYKTAESMKDKIGDSVTKFYTIEGKGHGYFMTANSDEFINNIVEQLKEGAIQITGLAIGSLIISSSILL